MKKKIKTNLHVFFISLFFLAVATFLYNSISYAQVTPAKSNCIVTQVGEPGIDFPLPETCTRPNGSGGWPFAKKDPSQFRRIDAGFDIQENHIEDPSTGKTWLYAIAAGTVHKQTGSGGGYGPHYPFVTLDKPIVYHGRTHTNYFYGHTVMIFELEGKHVNAGDKIAWTGPRGCSLPGVEYYHSGSPPNSWCGNGGSFWAEIGWGNSHPEGNDDRNVCINDSNINLDPLYNRGDNCAWTQSGKDMQDFLLGK